MTVVEDRTAFVEQLGVLIPDKRTQKQRLRVADARVQALEVLAEIRVASDLLRDLEMPDTDEAARDTAALRARLQMLEHKAARKRERLKALEADLRERDARPRYALTVRLHSATHYIDLSREQYVRLSAAQLTSPMLVLKSAGRQWWWHRDRFWWDDEHLAPRHVATHVLESDLDSGLERHLFEEAREAVLRDVDAPMASESISNHVRRTVWRRDAGRCVDCGSSVDVRFECVTSDLVEPGPDDLELRCRACSALRTQYGPGARGRSA